MIFSFVNITEYDEDYNDAAFFLIEVHDDLGEPKEQLGIEMERVCDLSSLYIQFVLGKFYFIHFICFRTKMTL